MSSSHGAAPVWQWDFDGTWTAYDPESSEEIEQGIQKNLPTFPLTKGWFNEARHRGLYQIENQQNGYIFQRNLRTNFRRNLKRYPPLDFHAKQKAEHKKKTDTEKKALTQYFQNIAFNDLTKNDACSICMDDFECQNKNTGVSNAIKLTKCPGTEKHYFHDSCVLEWLVEKKQCPVCKQRYGEQTGNQPKGEMHIRITNQKCSGYEQYKTIEVHFQFPHGIQGPEHAHPGKHYNGDYRVAYLPDNADGREIVRLIKIAWQRRLMFSLGYSITRHVDDVIIWNGIHMKTSLTGGSQSWGWPDPGYFDRVKQEFKDKGVE